MVLGLFGGITLGAASADAAPVEIQWADFSATQGKQAQPATPAEKEINLDEPAEGTAPPETPVETPTPEGGDDTAVGDICKIDPPACPR